MVYARCREYDDDGRSVTRRGCKRGDACDFVHPDQKRWGNAPRLSPISRPFGSGNNYDGGRTSDRMASSTWPIPDSPPRAGSSTIPPTKPKAAWDTTGWVDGSTRNDKGKSSSNSWTAGRRNVNKNDSITGASKSDSWGSGGSSWGGNKVSGNDDDMDAAWSVQGGIKKPSANKAGVGQVAGDDSTTSWGTPKDKPPPTQPSPISSDPRRNRQPPTGPAKRVERPKENITTPEISTKPSRWQSPPATVISAPVTPLISPVVFQRAPSMDRTSVKKPVDVLDSVLAITRNREDYSPVQSEQSHGASNLDRHRLQYRKGIEKMVALPLLQHKLAEDTAKLNHWKRIQCSKQFERARVQGRNKLNQTRLRLSKEVHGLKTRIEHEQRSLLRVPDLSSPPKFDGSADIASIKEKAAFYVKEADEWIKEYQKRVQEKEKAEREEKEKKEREEREREEAANAEPQPEPAPDPMRDLKERIKGLQEDIEDLEDDIDSSMTYDVAAEVESLALERTRSLAENLPPHIQRQREEIPRLRAEVNAKQQRVENLEAAHKGNLAMKAQLEQALTTIEEEQRGRAERIEKLRLELISLHNLSPVSQHEHLRPFIESLVDNMVKEQVHPIFDALATQCRIAATQRHELAATKIEEKLRPIESLTSQIHEAAAREAALVGGDH